VRIARLIPTVFLGLSLQLPAVAGPACASETVRLNEFMAGPARDWDGSGTFSSRDDEWIEIINTGTAAVDLAGFLLTDADSVPRYALSGTLGAGAVRLVTGKMSFDWEKANAKSAVGFSLSNTGDAVILWKIVGADTVVVDAYTFKSHEAAADRAVGREVDTGAWSLFDALDPYNGTQLPQGNHCAPTPGALNQCTTTPARASSWGRVKTIYR
jgi:hypothetical protein